jgi:hypothetical protein
MSAAPAHFIVDERSTMNQTTLRDPVGIGPAEVVRTSGDFNMVDLFLTLGGILLVGIVAKVAVGVVFGWQGRERDG